MKPALLMVLASGLILTGCAGMKSEFDCNATASNGCMTMDEANNKARAMTENQKGKKTEGRRTLPPLATVPVVKENSTTAGVSSVTKPVAVTFAGAQVSPAWSDIGMARPVRLPSTTARMWIAAWIDEQAVWHQPSVVSFEVKPARWQHQEVKV
ncbi:type IV conjugative transfer system lipoprotein TraV [Citrobacter freundii]|nr:type IV conjugative transfer system lipoprotein TraV [Citrobacter freundii]